MRVYPQDFIRRRTGRGAYAIHAAQNSFDVTIEYRRGVGIGEYGNRRCGRYANAG